MQNRRQFITSGAGLAAATLARPALAQDACSERLSFDDYQRYLELFNNNDMRFVEYYHPDVAFDLGDTRIEGADGIRDFYADVKQYIRETVTCTDYVADNNGVAVIIPTVFECIKDWPDSFWGIDLQQGQRLEITSWGFYGMEGGKFRSIKTTRAVGGEWYMPG